MITITLNGRAECLPPDCSVTRLLELQQLSGKRVAVERNGEIVPRASHGSVLLTDGDTLEIVVAVGGG